MIQIAQYEEKDREAVVKLSEELQDHLAKSDPLKRLRRLPEYGTSHVNRLLEKIAKNNGILYVAKTEDEVVGMIAGFSRELSQEDELENIPSKVGTITELIVSEKYRGMHAGSSLIHKMEEHFKSEGCDFVRADVFVANKDTCSFYQKHGFQNRLVNMVKNI